MILHLMIPRNNLRIARRRRPVTRPCGSIAPSSSTSRALLLGRVARTRLRSRGSSTAGVGSVGSVVVGGAVVHVALRPRLGLVPAARLGLAVAAVVHKDVDAAVFCVLGEVGVGVVIGGLGVLGDDVPSVEEARELLLREVGVSWW